MSQVIEQIPLAKKVLKGRKYMKSYKLAKLLGLPGQSGIVIAGIILARLPEWEPDRCQSVRRTWINTESEKSKSSRYSLIADMTPEEIIEHYEHMAKFWKVAGDKATAATYANKAEKARQELELVA